MGDDNWTREQQVEWANRYFEAGDGSQERVLLDDMLTTGTYIPPNPSSPVSPPPASPDLFDYEPPPAAAVQPTGIPSNATFDIPPAPAPAPAPAPGLPPMFPVPPPAQDPAEAVRKAQMNAFFDKKPQPTPEQEAVIRAQAQPGPQIPPGGIGYGTRRNVPTLGLPPAGGQRYKTRKSKKGGQIVTTFFNIRDQVKMYHWQTKSFAEHKATDDLVASLDTNIDKFVETYMGRYGRPLIKKTMPVKNLTVSGIRAFISRNSKWLETTLPRMIKKSDSDLLNIRDEILGDLNQVKYLFTLT
jgi:hypothetical protein